MSDIELMQALRQKPFQPFRIQVSDGTSYDIRHPEMVMATETAAYIGVPSGKKHRGFERLETVALEHVVKLLPIEAGKASKSK